MQGAITDESSRIAGPTGDEQLAPKGRATSDEISEALAETLGPHKYRIWFKNSTKFTLTAGYLKIGVPNLFIANWIENHFANEINRAVRAATGSELKITFAIDPELVANRKWQGANREGQIAKGDKRFAICDKRWDPFGAAATKTQNSKFKTQDRSRLKLTLNTFVVGPSNELAYSAARAVVREQQSPFNPLFVHGGYGVGKTHLLQGICNAVSESRPHTNWLYLSAEDFANQFVLALKTKKLQAFRLRMRQTDLLAIDDIHFLASKPSTQEEFLHTFNTINLAGKQIILASDAHPKMIGEISEKLVNRFISGMVVRIEPPNFQTRCKICRQYVAAIKTQNCGMPDNVIRYVAENLRANVRELQGALLKLIAYSALAGDGSNRASASERITLSVAQTILAEHLERCDPIVHISDIESAVAAYFGITPAHIHSAKKDRTVSLARHFSMYLTRKHTKMSSSQIGRLMGNKNHATVLLACKKVEQLIQRNAELHWHGSTGNKVAKAKTVLAHLEDSISA